MGRNRGTILGDKIYTVKQIADMWDLTYQGAKEKLRKFELLHENDKLGLFVIKEELETFMTEQLESES